MRKGISQLVCLVLILTCSSCKREMKAADYANYVTGKSNGLRKILQVDGWEYCIQYRPYDYIMLLENKGQLHNYDLKQRTAELSGTAWFTLSVKRADNSIAPMRYRISSLEEYNTRLNYYLNEAVKDYRLIYDKDTLFATSYLFENNYNLAPQETMVIGFNLPEGEKYPQKNMQLSFVDRVFKTGIINATYTKEKLANTPNLIY